MCSTIAYLHSNVSNILNMMVRRYTINIRVRRYTINMRVRMYTINMMVRRYTINIRVRRYTINMRVGIAITPTVLSGSDNRTLIIHLKYFLCCVFVTLKCNLIYCNSRICRFVTHLLVSMPSLAK